MADFYSIQYENNRTLWSTFSSEGRHGLSTLKMKDEDLKKYQLYENHEVVKEFTNEEVYQIL